MEEVIGSIPIRSTKQLDSYWDAASLSARHPAKPSNFSDPAMTPTVIILTFNSGLSLPATLTSLAGLTGDIQIVDSGSIDDTKSIAERFGAHFVTHPFENYGLQRNWAIDNVACKHPWQLHLDADEQLSPRLREEILGLTADGAIDGYFLPRYLKFMGRILRHNLAPTWHMRLFRNQHGRCEQRHYDQHFICQGVTARLHNEMIDDIRMPLTEWTLRHNRWSDAEVRELTFGDGAGTVQPRLRGNIVERKRSLRALYDRSPLFVRAFVLFSLRYFGGGFLDGKEGLIFCVLQTLWFRFLIDAKLYELELTAPSVDAVEQTAKLRTADSDN
jgi:glycosyltransferase involved in cell wall biosynthesis